MPIVYKTYDQTIREEFPGKLKQARDLGMKNVLLFSEIKKFSERQYGNVINYFTEVGKLLGKNVRVSDDNSFVDFTDYLNTSLEGEPHVRFHAVITYTEGKIEHTKRLADTFTNLEIPNAIVCAYIREKETI